MRPAISNTHTTYLHKLSPLNKDLHGGPRSARVGASFPASRIPFSPSSHLILTSSLTRLSHNRIVENDISESIYARTESLQALRELGPPDLVHLTKSQPKAGIKEVKIALELPIDCGHGGIHIIHFAGMTFDQKPNIDWHIPSCYRSGCLLLRFPGSIHQHPHLSYR